MVNEKAFWVALSSVSGIGPARLTALLDRFGSAEAVWTAPREALAAAGLDRRSLANLVQARRTSDPAKLWRNVTRRGLDCVTWDEETYPQNLRPVPGAPPVLYVDGTLVARDQWAVAIVGTRRASVYGREVAHRLATELARNEVTVVSGLALGIDTTAHQAAIDAGGRTIAVLGCGLDQVYPAQNRNLAAAIRRQGALVSDYPLGTRPEPRNFPPRNRIISGLSTCVVIVEAGTRSGALITAEFAADQGRDVFAVPGSILHPGSVGCNRLIQDGATPLLSIDDLLAQLDLERKRELAEVRRTMPSDPLEARVLARLNMIPQHVDDLARELALNSGALTGVLTTLELKGLVRQVSPLSYVQA